MLPRFYSAFLLCVTSITAPIFFLLACIIWLFTITWDKRLICLHYFTALWARFLLSLCPIWHKQVLHRERFVNDKPYILVSNHQSGIDILLAFRLVKPFKWLSKIEMFHVPFIGWNMYLNRYIALKRGDRRSVAKMSTQVGEHLARGSSVYMFPEGSRSPDGNMQSFKNGAFSMAKHFHVGIIPIAIHGTSNALPKKSTKVGYADMKLEVLPPIEAKEVAEKTATELRKQVQQQIAQALEQQNKVSK